MRNSSDFDIYSDLGLEYVFRLNKCQYLRDIILEGIQ